MPKPEDLTSEQWGEVMEAYQLATGEMPNAVHVKRNQSDLMEKQTMAKREQSTSQKLSDDQIWKQVQRTAAAMRKRPRPPAAPPAAPPRARKQKTQFIRVTSAVKIPETPLFAWINPEHIIDMAEYESESTGVFTKIRTTGKSVDVLEKPEDIIEMISKLD